MINSKGDKRCKEICGNAGDPLAAVGHEALEYLDVNVFPLNYERGLKKRAHRTICRRNVSAQMIPEENKLWRITA